MEPGLRASLRRIHAPKSTKLCVSKGGDSIFRAQLNGTVRLRVCLRGVGRGEVWRLVLELSLSLADEPQTEARQLFALEPRVQNRSKAAPD